MKKAKAPVDVQEQASALEVSHEIRGTNRDQAEAQLRRVAQIYHQLATQSLSLAESHPLQVERDAILAKWLD